MHARAHARRQTRSHTRTYAHTHVHDLDSLSLLPCALAPARTYAHPRSRTSTHARTRAHTLRCAAQCARPRACAHTHRQAYATSVSHAQAQQELALPPRRSDPAEPAPGMPHHVAALPPSLPAVGMQHRAGPARPLVARASHPSAADSATHSGAQSGCIPHDSLSQGRREPASAPVSALHRAIRRPLDGSGDYLGEGGSVGGRVGGDVGDMVGLGVAASRRDYHCTCTLGALACACLDA
jgi:hypothetical protein